MNKSPLEGIRIIDLSQVYAGPLAARTLADLGAEVIRVESAVRSTRGGPKPQAGAVYPGGDPSPRPYNRSASYNELHRNKLAITLDLSREEGRDIFKKLVAISDAVIENFSPRVMANFGLDYPVLEGVNPRIIMVSISAYGHTGPYRDYVSFGRGIEAMAGLSEMTGYPDSGPIGPGIAYADAVAGLHAALALLTALHERRQTGRGQHIDLSLRESLTALMGEYILGHSMATAHRSPVDPPLQKGKTGEFPQGGVSKGFPRNANRDSTALFQGCYRCRGEDKWIAIAIESDDEWQAFCRAIGTPAWVHDERFADLPGRVRNQTALDHLIEAWTSQHTPEEAMRILQKAGVKAGAVRSARGIFSDPHLRARGFFEKVTHREAGTHDYPGVPWKFSGTPVSIRRPAPCFAEHNDYVFGELLGMGKGEIARLESEGITARTPLR